MKIEVQFVRLLVILICWLSASLAFADSKNETKKQYDAIVNKVSRDLTDGKIDDAAADAKVCRRSWTQTIRKPLTSLGLSPPKRKITPRRFPNLITP